MKIDYREMTKSDYADIKKMITQAWFSDEEYENIPDSVIRLYSKGYLYIYLSESDYGMVALDDDKPIGFLFGRAKKINFFKKMYYKTKLFFVGLRLLFSKSGRRGLKITFVTNKSNKKLYKSLSEKPKAELALFIVDENYRGNKIGSILEEKFCKHLIDNSVDSVYLYTDTYSNFEYYEHRNYMRLGEIDVDFKIKGEEMDPLPKYYIYVKKLGDKK